MTENTTFNNKLRLLSARLKKKGITDQRILNAIETIPRHLFVDERFRSQAYENKPLLIGNEQTISQPYTVAFQTQLLDFREGDKVLEIGTGSGYQAAVLSAMGAKVYSLERFKELHLTAKLVLEKLGYPVELFCGDGFEGLPEHGPFDRILITAAAPEIPPKLVDQLAVGGKLVLPLGSQRIQTMTIIERVKKDEFIRTEHGQFVFVPMLRGVVDL